MSGNLKKLEDTSRKCLQPQGQGSKLLLRVGTTARDVDCEEKLSESEEVSAGVWRTTKFKACSPSREFKWNLVAAASRVREVHFSKKTAMQRGLRFFCETGEHLHDTTRAHSENSRSTRMRSGQSKIHSITFYVPENNFSFHWRR